MESCCVSAVCAVMELLFSEELGLVLEVSQRDVETVCQRYSDAGVQCHRIGTTCGFGPESMVRVYPQHPSQAHFFFFNRIYQYNLFLLVFSRSLFTLTDVKY